MLDLVATGYGRAALDALRSVVSRAKTGDPLAPVVVVVPNHVAGTVARRHLARHGLEGGTGPGVAGLEITTLARLAERLAASDLAPRRPATRQVVASAWRRALRTSPGVFAETSEHPATVRALVAAHRELRDLSPSALHQVAAAGRVSRDLVRLHHDVVTLLEPSWYDVTDLLEAATARAAHVGAPVVLYLPQDLCAAETRFVDALASVGDVVVLAGRTHVAASLRERCWLQIASCLEFRGTEVATAIITDERERLCRQVVGHVIDMRERHDGLPWGSTMLPLECTLTEFSSTVTWYARPLWLNSQTPIPSPFDSVRP